MAAHTFLWHDYETFGISPRRDRPAQFAAIRTDDQLNEIGDPLMIYCQPATDYLPDPQSCLITGITPQLCGEKGLPEHQFAQRIQTELAQPGTVGVGYNTLRFDDEVTRFLFWRNLIDPYAREWQNQCGRWDLLDVVRMYYALRPEGIAWPRHEDGRPSFKLEDLTRANGIVHEAAHDALSDVRATIGLARLLRQANPKLFDFAFALHRKQRVAEELRLPVTQAQARPFLHVSGMFAPERGCLAVMWPLADHPVNRNEILAWDLSQDPSVLAGLSADDIRLRVFTRSEDLPEGVQRLPIKSVHVNRSPMVVSNLDTLRRRPDLMQRWGIDLSQCEAHGAIAKALPDLRAVWEAVYAPAERAAPVDVDEDLYGGFIGRNDRAALDHLRQRTEAQWTDQGRAFDDPRLEELVFRYRARNFPATLSDADRERWESHRHARLVVGEGGARTVEALLERIDQLSEQVEDERAEEILGALYDWADTINPAW